MADGSKTRPTDNFHCFQGRGFVYWHAKASGHQPSRETRASPDGHIFDYAPDADGFAMNNGGISKPIETTLGLRKLFRFFDSTTSAKDALAGNWWQDLDALAVMTNFALNNEMSLSRAAQLLLIVPKNWGDCSNLLIVKPNTVLKAFVGKGNPVAITASGKSTSPDAKRKSGTAVYAAGPGNNLEQIYIPGTPMIKAIPASKGVAATSRVPGFLEQFLDFQSVHHIDMRGILIPAIPLSAGGK